jgi:hypothetical protein
VQPRALGVERLGGVPLDGPGGWNRSEAGLGSRVRFTWMNSQRQAGESGTVRAS